MHSFMPLKYESDIANQEMIAILRQLQEYVPLDSFKKPISIGFGSDQKEHGKVKIF